MADLREYDVVINGFPTTLRLSEADAKAQGLWRDPVPAKQAPRPANKARGATGKARKAAGRG